MYNRQLDTFLKVAETGSFSAAAEALFISPSAVIQQINILEKDLQVSLFVRSKRGVALTEAGDYLVGQARDYIYRSGQIRKHLVEIATRGRTLSVGTSLMEKCRLLYPYWLMFSREGHDYDVRMVMIGPEHPALDGAELVEGVRDNAPWQRGWEFLELCEVPIGCAVSHDHPLFDRERFTYEDLRSSDVILLDRGNSAPYRDLARLLTAERVRYDVRRECSGSLIWDCSIRHQILVAPLCWDDVLFDLKVRPCVWDYTVPYGFFYRKDASPPLRDFLAFVRQLRADEARRDSLPTL